MQPVKTKKKLSRADKKQIEAAIVRANRTDKKGKSAQDSIPYERMWPDGICRISDSHYTKTIQLILLHQAAKNAFDEMGVKKLPKVKELQTEYAKLLEEKKKTYAEYRRSREEMRELLTAKANVDRVLKMEVEQDVEKEKDHGQR